MPGSDLDLVRHALWIARERGFTEVEVEHGGLRFSATMDESEGAPGQWTRPAAAPNQRPEPEEKAVPIKAPLVGYYQPTVPALEVGRTVSQGDVVGIIRALGLSNEVETPFSGTVVEVLVSDGEPVQYGQPIARVLVTA